MAPFPMPPGIITRSMEAPDMARKTDTPAPEAPEAPHVDTPAQAEARERYAAACAAERAAPSRSTAQATDAAAVALYRALHEARA